MACYHPITVEHNVNAFGEARISFNPLNDTQIKRYKVVRSKSIQIPCGKCLGCRLEYARAWSVRCMHEASYYMNSAFITLTYAPEHLPKGGSLDKEHLQLFIKRLRNAFGSGVRYFACGEYGSRLSRPHYHLLVFGVTFSDGVRFSRSRKNPIYTSEKLSILWPYGHSSFGSVTQQSAAYVARYTCKKVSSPEYYAGKCPEFCIMSRRRGIGYRWIEEYYKDVYAIDRVIIDAKVNCKPPRYYDKFLKEVDAGLYDEVKQRRLLSLDVDSPDLVDVRLKAREKVQFRRFSRLTRELEQGSSDFSQSDSYFQWSEHDVDEQREAQDAEFYRLFKELDSSSWQSLYEGDYFSVSRIVNSS